jgi:hypothetical protein
MSPQASQGLDKSTINVLLGVELQDKLRDKNSI